MSINMSICIGIFVAACNGGRLNLLPTCLNAYPIPPYPGELISTDPCSL